MSLRLALPLLGLLALCACATDGQDAKPQAAITPTQQFSMTATERQDEVRLAAHGGGLSDAQSAALSDLARRWLQSRQPEVTIQEPAHPADPRAVDAVSFAARALLASLGVPPDRVQRTSYEPAGQGQAPVIIGFKAYDAAIPKCGQSFDRVSATSSNLPMSNFGCAVTANMAAQIADPGDLVDPRQGDPADAERRAQVLDKYHKGETTSTSADRQAQGLISALLGGGG